MSSYLEEYDKKLKNCPQCKKDLHQHKCADCSHYICFDCKICSDCSQQKSYWGGFKRTMCKSHKKCLECGEKVVCHFKGICAPCDKPFHKINDTVTVGSCGTPYDDYDLIFNLNYPENGAEKHQISYIYGKRPNDWNSSVKKNFYNIGMYDHSTPEDLKVFRECIEILKEIVEKQKKDGKDLNILFHCFAGYSRSVALATAYIALKEGVSVDEAFELVKSRRKYVGPNPDFIDIVREEV